MNRGRFGPPRQRRRQAAASGKEARMIPAPLSCNPRMARRRQSVRAKTRGAKREGQKRGPGRAAWVLQKQ